MCVPVSTLRPVDFLSGLLTDSDCRLSDGSVRAEYVLTLPTFGQLQLTAASTDFDVTLFLRDAAGRRIESGATIQRTVERGEYTVVGNALKPGQTGKFSLSSMFQPEPNTLCRDITRIGPGQTISGQLLDSSCRLFNNAPYDGYRVTLFGAGTLDVALSSPNFSGLVTLRGDDGRALASDAAAISVTVPGGGDYTVLAARADASCRGDYSLVLKFTPSDDETCRSLKTLRSSEDVKGSIDDGSCRFGADSLFTYYDLIVNEAGFADLRVVPAGEMSTLVAVPDRNGPLLAEDLQSGGVNKPILGQQLAPGAYTALIITQSKGGDYTLRYRFTPGPPAICPAPEMKLSP